MSNIVKPYKLSYPIKWDKSLGVLESVYGFESLIKLHTELQFEQYMLDLKNENFTTGERLVEYFEMAFNTVIPSDEFLTWVDQTVVNQEPQIDYSWKGYYAPVTHTVEMSFVLNFTSKDLALLFKLRWQ